MAFPRRRLPAGMSAQRAAVWLWLAAALGPAAPNAGDILRMYPDPQRLVAERRTVDLSLILTKRQLGALLATEPEDFSARLADCRRQGVQVTCFDEDDYPPLLREIPSPPPVLYWRGDIAAARGFAFAIVGARKPSSYGVEATALIAKTLAEAGVTLVSGLASGLDGEAHKAALAANAPTVACIAFGHDKCYPASHRALKADIERRGLVLGEYPPGTPPSPGAFLQRNRLIAGLSRGVCVAEARRRSGTMNTVSQALAYGRDVFAVPGSIFSPLSEGTNHLLAEGACVATDGAEILEYYGLRRREPSAEDKTDAPAQPALSEEAKRMAKAVGAKEKTLAQLCAESGLATGAAMAALTELELAGKVRALAGRRYVLR
ncbi:MAG TPA: DNA-processing protein DprA [Candidatus Ruthenibacterium merdigallinarum]|nr:DNA-processing protein DprA [Candidatus Ruthenibacterium merdigallinarum]